MKDAREGGEKETHLISNRVLLAGQERLLDAVLLPAQMVLENAVKTTGLVLVTLDAVRDLLRSVAEEVVGLSYRGKSVRGKWKGRKAKKGAPCIGPTPP
jgi:hypothetical protein